MPHVLFGYSQQGLETASAFSGPCLYMAALIGKLHWWGYLLGRNDMGTIPPASAVASGGSVEADVSTALWVRAFCPGGG